MRNHLYKLLVVDIDGTLLDRNGKISDEDKEALVRAVNSGIRVSLSTGRAVQASMRIIDRLSLEGYHIFFDGALVTNPGDGQEVYVEPIAKELVRQIVEFVQANGITNIDFFSANKFFIERETWVSDIRRKFFGLDPTIVDFAQLWQEERIIKGTLVVRTAEQKALAESFYRRFENSLGLSVTTTPAYPETDFINVLAPEVSKGKALEALASFLGIPLTEVIAIGDGANDIPLLTKAGLAIAMGNATDELKAVADYVTLDVEHNGVAMAVKRFWCRREECERGEGRE